MASPLTSTVVIECPHCGTRYQLPAEAIGPKGRQVACAHCGKTWQAKATAMVEPADADKLFDAAAEDALDDAFEAEEAAAARAPVPVPAPSDEPVMRSMTDITAAIAPKPKPAETTPAADPTGDHSRQRAFTKRQAALSKQSPLAKVRRVVRLAGVSVLLVLIGCGMAFRTEIVGQFPDLAGAYEALGLGVNVIGLEFRDVTTMVTLRGGSRVMQVDARIYSVAARDVTVPPVVVTLLDASDVPLYQWSVAPAAKTLEPGEVVDFSAQLNTPPQAATRVRLTFIDGNARTESPVSTAAATGT